MRITRLLAIALVALAVSLAAAPAAHAISFKFDNPAADLPNLGSASDCEGGDLCGVSPSWTKDGLTVTATVFRPFPAGDLQIIQDLSPDLGGLGVVEVEEDDGDLEQDGNDNVDGDGPREAIQLHFDVPIFLNTVTFNGDHVALPAWKDYLFRVDAGSFGQRNFGDTDFGGLLGQDFYFKWGGDHPKDFYIASLDADPVPEPGTLVLMGMGLAGLASRARRRLRG